MFIGAKHWTNKERKGQTKQIHNQANIVYNETKVQIGGRTKKPPRKIAFNITHKTIFFRIFLPISKAKQTRLNFLRSIVPQYD